MVKREKSPTIPEDARYLVIYQPYPLNADFDLPDDCIAFAFWVAVVLGSYKPVWGIHHKPSARSTVIVEVDREINLNNLLGEHRWKDVLKKPKKDEKERFSRAFCSIYNATSDARKDGWRHIQVEPGWFTDRRWNLTGGPFKHPYPPPVWCPALAEDPTGKAIARPLLGSVKPPPPPDAPSLVPGSVEWVEAASSSSGPSPGTPSAASGSTTQRGRGTAWGQRGARGGSGAERRGRPAHIEDPSAAPVQTLAAGNSNPWNRISSAPPLSASTSQTGSPRPTSPRSPPLSYSKSVTSSRAPGPAAFPSLATSPGLTKRINPLASPSPASPTTTSSPRSPATATSRSWADLVKKKVPPEPPGLPRVAESAPSVNETAAVSLAGLSLQTSGDEEDEEDEEGDDDDDDEDFGDVGYAGGAGASWLAASSFNANAATSSQKAGGSGSGSADVDLWAQSSVPAEESEPLCSMHGIKCTKGICSEYRKSVRDKKWAAEVAERKAAIERAKERRAGRGIISRGKKPEEPEEPEDEDDKDEGEQQQRQQEKEEEEKEEEPKEEPEQPSGSTTGTRRERRWKGARS